MNMHSSQRSLTPVNSIHELTPCSRVSIKTYISISIYSPLYMNFYLHSGLVMQITGYVIVPPPSLRAKILYLNRISFTFSRQKVFLLRYIIQITVIELFVLYEKFCCVTFLLSQSVTHGRYQSFAQNTFEYYKMYICVFGT